MNRLSEFLGRTGIAQVAEKFPSLPIGRRDPLAGETLDEAGFTERGTNIGQKNEGLRSLLVEAGRRIDDLDVLKQTFDDILEPVSKLLRELEQEKSHNASLRNLLAETRQNYEKLRADHNQSEKKRAAAEGENEQLSEDLELAQQNVRALEGTRAELSGEISVNRTQLANLERQLAAESAQRQSLADDNRTFGEQIAVADKKIVLLESEIQGTRANLVLSEDEKRAIQKSLEQNVGEVSRLSRRLSDTDGDLAAARAKIAQLETTLKDNAAERGRIVNKLEETIERQRTENNTLSARLESLQSRAGSAEKLLAETRQNLTSRTEELRDYDRKATEANIARNSADKTARQLEAAHEALERQIADLTQSRATLVERSGLLGKTLKTREAALARAEQKIGALSERAGSLEAELQASRSADEKRFDELNAALNRERMQRAVAEGALEGSRKDFARAQRELSARGANQRSKGAKPVVHMNPADLAKSVAARRGPDIRKIKIKNGKRPASNVEPIIKN